MELQLLYKPYYIRIKPYKTQKKSDLKMEYPIINKKWTKGIKSLAIVYPNLYYGGVYCLAPNIIYNIANSLHDWICERQFLDNHKDLSNFDLVGFTFQYELDYYNILKLIKKYSPKITFAGGPVVNSNPNLLKDKVDFLVLGEVEDILPKILNEYGKEDFLERISKIKGVYVKNISKKFEFSDFKDLDSLPYPYYQPFPEEIDKNFVFGKPFILEIERGCPFKCKFCSLSGTYKSIRLRSLEKIKEIIDKGVRLNERDKVLIYSPSFSHTNRKEILEYLVKKGLKFSIPSIKVEFMDDKILRLIKLGGQKTLTIAPECNESLRKKIGKLTSDKQYLDFIDSAKRLDFEKIKVYLVIGLPEQTEQDIVDTVELIKKFKDRFNNISLSINYFVPKKNSEFQYHKFDKIKNTEQAKIIKQELSKLKIKYKIANLNLAYKEYKLAVK